MTRPLDPARVTPVRIQLSRKRGFNLQEVSRAINGLPAVSVARPGKWGNPHDWREWRENCPANIVEWEGVGFRDQWCREMAVDAYREDLEEGLLPDPRELRGKNLACWCVRYQNCHADVLLELANR
jgi:hypothetical protein